MHLLWWIIVGLIAGWATGKIMRGSGYGPIVDVIIGIIGAVVGGWIMRALGFSGQGGMTYTILVAIGGAVVLTWPYRAVTAIPDWHSRLTRYRYQARCLSLAPNQGERGESCDQSCKPPRDFPHACRRRFRYLRKAAGQGSNKLSSPDFAVLFGRPKSVSMSMHAKFFGAHQNGNTSTKLQP
jgi:uncharacterized membrane protein YeaQ/YmgE (transglycosylase-associated protein family)